MMSLRKNAGFTLVEIVTAMAVLAVLAAVSAVSYRILLPDLRLKAAVRDLKSDVSLARLQAIRDDRCIGIDFDIGTNSYTLFQDDGGGTDCNRSLDTGETTIKTVSMPTSVTMYSATFASGSTYDFNSRGQTLGGTGAGSIKMRNTNGNYRQLTITMISGKAQIQISKDNGATWQAADY